MIEEPFACLKITLVCFRKHIDKSTSLISQLFSGHLVYWINALLGHLEVCGDICVCGLSEHLFKAGIRKQVFSSLGKEAIMNGGEI